MAKAASREISCSIAGTTVHAVLRRGGMLGGPERTYVWCSERSCQYADLNRPPCPLSVALFQETSDRLVAAHIVAQVGFMCLGCISLTLGITHEQVRHALWGLVDDSIARLRPGRCRGCGRRRVVVGADRPRTAPRRVRPPIASPAGTDAAAPARILAYLSGVSDTAFCPACLALATKNTLTDVVTALAPRGALERFAVMNRECAACGRRMPVLAAAPPPQRASARP